MRHKLVIEGAPRERRQATCTCGWRAVGTDKRDTGASSAWVAHMYAQGFRTTETIQAAAL